MSTDTGTPWDLLSEPAEIAEALLSLYVKGGGGRYGEAVTQTEHAVQTGAYAMAAGASDAGILAAFFHDIGHLLEPDGAERHGAADGVDRAHEQLGAAFLARFFDDDVTGPVRLHVAAKRYLCTVDPAYVGGLSPASVRSLALQGGPMNDAELAAFEATPAAMRAVNLRRWDDLAKVAGAPAPDLTVFQTLTVDVLEDRRHRSP